MTAIARLSDMPRSAADAIGSKGSIVAGSGRWVQNEFRNIDHYIDGIDAAPRVRAPFSPVAYMRTGDGSK